MNRFCASCGNRFQASDAFCGGCGAERVDLIEESPKVNKVTPLQFSTENTKQDSFFPSADISETSSKHKKQAPSPSTDSSVSDSFVYGNSGDVSASRAPTHRNQPPYVVPDKQGRRGKPSEFLTMLLSIALVGLGHYYLGEYGKGTAYLFFGILGWFTLILLTTVYSPFVFFLFFLGLLAVYVAGIYDVHTTYLHIAGARQRAI